MSKPSFKNRSIIGATSRWQATSRAYLW